MAIYRLTTYGPGQSDSDVEVDVEVPQPVSSFFSNEPLVDGPPLRSIVPKRGDTCSNDIVCFLVVLAAGAVFISRSSSAVLSGTLTISERRLETYKDIKRYNYFQNKSTIPMAVKI